MKFLGPPSSGSIAGTTSSHNRAGQYTRNRRTPVNPIGTGRRALVRANFSASSSAWAALTFSEQAAWGAYADAHPIVDKLGQSIKLTGHQMYVSINANLQNANQGISSVPPLSSAVYSASGSTVAVLTDGTVIVEASGTGVAADFLLIALSQVKSGGVAFNKTFWQASVEAGDVSDPFDVSQEYIGQFGVPPLGGRVFFRLTPVNQYGVAGTPVIGFATVAAGAVAAVVTPGAAGIINWTNAGPVPNRWAIFEGNPSGTSFTFNSFVTGATLTKAGLTSGNTARIIGVDAGGNPTTLMSNTVTIV